MTVATTTSVVEYNGNGVQKVFTVPFRFLDAGHLRVSSVLLASPYTENLLVLGADYTVGGAGSVTGGTVALLDPANDCPTGYKLRVRRLTPRMQGVPFSTQGEFSPKAHETALDRLTMGWQEINDGALLSVQNFDFLGPTADAGLVTATGSNTPRPLSARFADVVNVKDYGAVGDGVTDDTTAIQAAVLSIAPYGSSHNAYALQPSYTLKLPPGKTYRITGEVSVRFRNFLTIDFTGATLKWDGAADGRMFDCMGCNYLRVVGDLVNGNNLLGTFMRVSGGNTAGAGGKNNATGVRFQGFDLRNMYASGVKPWIQTTNDTPVYGDYSLDDSECEGVWFASPGYGAIELASSEVRFDRCQFVSVTRGIIYRTGTLTRLSHTVFSGVRYPHYVVQNASVGEISNTDCYAEGINSAGPTEGSFLYVETGGSTTAVKSFSIRGGDYSQGADANVTTASDFLACNGARASVYIDGPRWQSPKNGRINLGTNARAFIRKSTLSSSYVDYMPEIVGAAVYERIERSGAFQLSVPSVDTVTLTVDAAGSDDYGALTFTTIEKALALVDQLGATQTIIDVKSNQALTTQRYVAGNLRITSSNGSTLTFNEELRVRPGGSLTVDTITIGTGTSAQCVRNQGGMVFAYDVTINNAAGTYFVTHTQGVTACAHFTLQAGRLVNASYAYGVGCVQIAGGNTYTSAELVAVKSGSPIEVTLSSTAAPGSGNWDAGIKTAHPSPPAGGNVGTVCTAAGTPGTWKTFGAVSA